MRITIHVRPGSSRAAVGGEHDGALVVRVVEPAASGRATRAALRAVAEALGVPARAVTLVSGATARRKIVEIVAAPADADALQSGVQRLLASNVKP